MNRKVAVISGASSGIGESSAIRLAKEGFDLVIAARRKEVLEAVAEKCRAEGVEVLAVPTDMSQEEQVENLFKTAVEHFGKIDFYYCNQGVLTNATDFEEQTLDQFYTVSENNFKADFLALKHSIRVMKAQGGGNILVTGSSSGIRPEAGFGVYSASKAAVIQMVKDAAIECSRYNIRINCVCPGGVNTPMLHRSVDYVLGSQYQFRRLMTGLLPREAGNENATPEEISGFVSFMASDASTFMTGSVVSIDNGITQ